MASACDAVGTSRGGVHGKSHTLHGMEWNTNAPSMESAWTVC